MSFSLGALFYPSLVALSTVLAGSWEPHFRGEEVDVQRGLVKDSLDSDRRRVLLPVLSPPFSAEVMSPQTIPRSFPTRDKRTYKEQRLYGPSCERCHSAGPAGEESLSWETTKEYTGIKKRQQKAQSKGPDLVVFLSSWVVPHSWCLTLCCLNATIWNF